MGHSLTQISSDFRLVDCKHERLRKALEFRPAHAKLAITAPTPTAAPTPKPVFRSDLEVTIERTTPLGFLAGAVTLIALSLIWTVLTCAVDMSC